MPVKKERVPASKWLIVRTLTKIAQLKPSKAESTTNSFEVIVYFNGKGTGSPFILTNEVRAQNEWTFALLEERQQRLLGVLT
jgi:hypothetical protein